MNALKHGLSSQEIVIFDEDPLEFEGLRAALEEAFQPVDAFERELVDQLAGLFWRLRRIPKLEAEVLRTPVLKTPSTMSSKWLTGILARRC